MDLDHIIKKHETYDYVSFDYELRRYYRRAGDYFSEPSDPLTFKDSIMHAAFFCKHHFHIGKKGTGYNGILIKKDWMCRKKNCICGMCSKDNPHTLIADSYNIVGEIKYGMKNKKQNIEDTMKKLKNGMHVNAGNHGMFLWKFIEDTFDTNDVASFVGFKHDIPLPDGHRPIDSTPFY